jgi:hypothetical protein
MTRSEIIADRELEKRRREILHCVQDDRRKRDSSLRSE